MTEKKTFIFRGRDLLVNAALEPADVQASSVIAEYTDLVSGNTGIAVSQDFTCPEGTVFLSLREYFASQDEEKAALAARMKGLTEWRKVTNFCTCCGKGLKAHTKENAMVCPECGHVHYPRISPCVIAVIRKGKDILLLRHRQRNQDIFACLAGFVETGETLEQALQREVREETGLEICNIRYAGSQSWPFPDQLMLGFYADYKSGSIKVQEDEIIEAGWFPSDKLPATPRTGSISYKLIHFEL